MASFYDSQVMIIKLRKISILINHNIIVFKMHLLSKSNFYHQHFYYYMVLSCYQNKVFLQKWNVSVWLCLQKYNIYHYNFVASTLKNNIGNCWIKTVTCTVIKNVFYPIIINMCIFVKSYKQWYLGVLFQIVMLNFISKNIEFNTVNN